MRSYTDESDTPPEDKPITKDTAYPNESYSDGSVYTFENAQTCAGYAFTRPNVKATLIPIVQGDLEGEHIEVYINYIDTIKEHIPCHPVWHSPDATLNHTPSATNSYRAEARGLDKAVS